MVWSQQFYHYDVASWLDGDTIPPPEAHRSGRNADWRHINNHDVIAMPDKWEYPWYASWDLAFHCVVLAHIDPSAAKHQLLRLEAKHLQRVRKQGRRIHRPGFRERGRRPCGALRRAVCWAEPQ
jgi:hypothetical protein